MSADVSFNFVCQMTHWSFAAFLTLTVARLAPSAIGAYIVLAICAAAIKEFWYDLKYETPDAMGSGGIKGSIEDFTFYMIGLVSAMIILSV